MEEETLNTQSEAVNTETETTEQTLGEMINPEAPKEELKTIGLDKFLDLKKENKELRNQLNDLAKRIESGDNKQDIADDIETLAEEHDIDKSFLNKLVKSIETKAERSLEEKLNAKIEPLTKSQQENKFNETFNNALNKAVKDMPEYQEIINPEVLKALALSPVNAKKTMAQIIEETYGNLITGRRTIETTKPGGGKEPAELDYNKANSDSEYFKEVMANPKLKAQFNERNLAEVSKYM